MNITTLAQIIHQNNKEKGFWDSPLNVGERLMLTVSELSEALEADRKGIRADREKLRKALDTGAYTTGQAFEIAIKDSFEDELADAVIRLIDLASGMGIDLEWHIVAKVDYNKTRPHKHGKKY